MTDNNNLIKLWGNSDKRQAFLKDYRAWGLWFTTPELGLTWYRYIMPDETVIIAMEYEHEAFVSYPDNYELRTTVRYYFQEKGKPFSPGSHSSISAIAERLKNAKVSLMNEARSNQDNNVQDAIPTEEGV